MGKSLVSEATFVDNLLGSEAECSVRYVLVVMNLKLSSDRGVSTTIDCKIQVFTKAILGQLVNWLKYHFLDWMSILYLCSSQSRCLMPLMNSL